MRHWSGCRACPSGAGCKCRCSVPSGSRRGMKKQDRPRSVCASTRCASHCGAEKNHLWPVMRYEPSAERTARVVLARTSEPPCFSVIPMPMRPPRLCSKGMSRGSYSRGRSRGTQFALEPRVPAHGRDGPIGHGGRAQCAALHLRLHQIARGPRHMGAGDGPAVGQNPRVRCDSPGRDALHQGVPGRVKFDGIDALAAHVEGMQHRAGCDWRGAHPRRPPPCRERPRPRAGPGRPRRRPRGVQTPAARDRWQRGCSPPAGAFD